MSPPISCAISSVALIAIWRNVLELFGVFNGSDWICLSLDPAGRNAPLPEYTHLAFSIPEDEFNDAVAELQETGVTSWQNNRSPGNSFYFLDRDGPELEIHSSDRNAWMKSLRREPPRELVLFAE
jgi:glutathione S-transferase fosA5